MWMTSVKFWAKGGVSILVTHNSQWDIKHPSSAGVSAFPPLRLQGPPCCSSLSPGVLPVPNSQFQDMHFTEQFSSCFCCLFLPSKSPGSHNLYQEMYQGSCLNNSCASCQDSKTSPHDTTCPLFHALSPLNDSMEANYVRVRSSFINCQSSLFGLWSMDSSARFREL